MNIVANLECDVEEDEEGERDQAEDAADHLQHGPEQGTIYTSTHTVGGTGNPFHLNTYSRQNRELFTPQHIQ